MAPQVSSELESTESMPLGPEISPRARRLRVGAWQVARDLPASFRYAFQGLVYAFASQRNFRIHVFTGVVVFVLGLLLQLNVDRLAVLVLTIIYKTSENDWKAGPPFIALDQLFALIQLVVS